MVREGSLSSNTNTDQNCFHQVLPNGNLVFPPFRAEDYRQEVHAQVYACLARNQVGTIHSRDVNVRAGKTIVPSLQNIHT